MPGHSCAGRYHRAIGVGQESTLDTVEEPSERRGKTPSLAGALAAAQLPFGYEPLDGRGALNLSKRLRAEWLADVGRARHAQAIRASCRLRRKEKRGQAPALQSRARVRQSHAEGQARPPAGTNPSFGGDRPVLRRASRHARSAGPCRDVVCVEESVSKPEA